MTPVQWAIAFIDMFSTGLMQPVLSLLLLGRGATLSTLPLLICTYSMTVFLFEFPSGVFADMKGRKAAFVTATALNAASMPLLMLRRDFLTTMVAMVLLGLGKAFSSGSYDALVIDDCIMRRGKGWAKKAASQLAVCQSLGISIGALFGGLLPETKGFTAHLAVRTVLLLSVLVLSALAVKERPSGGKKHTRLKGHLMGCGSLIMEKPVMIYAFMGVFATGGLILTTEVYWQPSYKLLSDAGGLRLLGLISFLGFGAAALGNMLAHKLSIKDGSLATGFFLSRAAVGALAVLLALQRSPVGFIAAYGMVYMLLGSSEILEKGLMNGLVPSDRRASMLSLLSLVMQAGGFLASGLAGLVVTRIGIGGVWAACGAFLVCICAAPAMIRPLASARAGNQTRARL